MRGCNERKKTGIGIGIIIVCFIVLSITSFTLFIYGSDLRTYSDATCKTIAFVYSFYSCRRINNALYKVW